MRPCRAAAKVVIAPPRSGSGARLKILDAMAMGKAVVATTIGAEGLMVKDGQHLLLADTPQTFADAVIRILRVRLEQNGRRLVEQYYDWQMAAAVFEQACERVAEQHKEQR